MKQPRMVDPMIAELEQEGQTTLRMLERVPEDQLEWRPHEKSMTLGQLAYHLASLQGAISGFLEVDAFDLGQADFAPTQPGSKAEIMAAFGESLAAAKARLDGLSDADAMSEWRMTNGEEELWVVPKAALARSLLLNHAYHHRGQLSVYLRLLGVPVPVTYGQSADESRFN